MITEAQILAQRRRPHRSGLIPKGELHRRKEREREQAQQREVSTSEQTGKVNNVAQDIVIQQTEAGGGNFYQFEPDVYEAVISDIEMIPNPYEEGKDQLQWTFEFPGYENEDGTIATKRAYCNPVWNAKAKLWTWAQAILGTTPAPDEPFRTSSLIGKGCRVVMVLGTKQDGSPFTKIDSLLAAKAAVNGKKPAKNLRARLEADPPAGTTVVETDKCATPGCGREAEEYTSRGTPFCSEHMP